ncbi:MAG: glycosyl transferase family protein [Parcubacteria group bacterium Gr01-1014_17]|nr:MAG: glycosyl transferase family protein [Parcubacteria group bacterium Gr01-1014_17]
MNQLLSIIVPAYNEEKTIARVLARLIALSFPKGALEIIVVNDGSTDGTAAVLAQFLQKIILISHTQNRGKGAAMRAGLARAHGLYTIAQDADAEYAPEEIPALLAELQNSPDADALYGSRNLTPTGRGYAHYVLGAWLLTKCVNLVFRAHLTDTYSCYKIMRTDLFRSLNLASNGFEIEMEITARLLKNKKKIIEAPISYAPRAFQEGKKIRWFDGIRGLATLLRIVLE